MDVDSPPHHHDELITYFAVRADEFAWNGDVRERILARRAAMSGLLFFDILLQLGGIDDPDAIYPPANLYALKRLLDAIESASYDAMKRDCLIYYLLKQSSDGREVGYVSEKVISPHYVALADAYWELDSGINLEGALSKLSDARIVKEYTTKIMETLELHPESGTLIRKFVRTCKPALREPSDLERYMVATAKYSVVEAWKYQRTFPDNYPARKTLLHKLVAWTLTPKPKPLPLTQLLALPFSRYEESVLQDFAMHPPETLPPASIGVVRDMVCVRLIQSCKYTAAVRFDRQYPSSGAGARGTWGTERERIVKEILSIMPAAERDLLETELSALGEDVRMRTSSAGRANANQPWSNSNLGASGSADLGASWEDIGRRTAGAPRKSFGGRPRTSLPNGMAAKPSMFTAGASTSSPRPAQPLSGQSTLISQNGTASTSASSPSHIFSSFVSSAESPSSAARLFAEKAPAPPKANGVANGVPKTNAFMTRNAFFEPPEQRSPSPEVFEVKRTSAVPNTSPKRAQPQPTTRLPTPPQEDIEREQESPTLEGQTQNERVEAASSASVEGEGEDHSLASEREDLGFSIFGAAAPAPTMRLTPSSGESSPKNRRKSSRVDLDQDEGADSQRKKLRVSVPGAFVPDEDHEHELPSPTSATVNQPRAQVSNSASRRTPSRTAAGRRSSRKRAASPDDSADNNDTHHLSIPGTLFEDDEDESLNRANGRTDSHVPHNNGDADSEEADELGPLPTHRTRRKTDPAANLASPAGVPRTPRRGTRSLRGNSAEPEEGLVSQSTGRPVRRSTRLQSVELSPTAERAEKIEQKKEKNEKEARPRKSTRTAGAGATATGRGATKRR